MYACMRRQHTHAQTHAHTHTHTHTHAHTHTHTFKHTHCIVNQQILYSEASRATKPLDGCLETGSSTALNAVFFFLFFFQIPSNSFNLQHLAFAFALDAGEYVELCNKKRLSQTTVCAELVAMPHNSITLGQRTFWPGKIRSKCYY